MSWRSVRSWLCTTSHPPRDTTTRASAARARARAADGSGGGGGTGRGGPGGGARGRGGRGGAAVAGCAPAAPRTGGAPPAPPPGNPGGGGGMEGYWGAGREGGPRKRPWDGGGDPPRTPGRQEETAAMEDRGDHGARGGHDRPPERHRVEELRRDLADGVHRRPLGHRHDVGGDEVTRNLVERDLAENPHVRQRRPASRGTALPIRADEGQDHTRPEEPDRLDQIVHALVGPRRAQKHDDLLRGDAERRPRARRIVTRRVPRIGGAHARA